MTWRDKSGALRARNLGWRAGGAQGWQVVNWMAEVANKRTLEHGIFRLEVSRLPITQL